MSRFLITSLIASIILSVPQQDRFTLTEILRDYDSVKDVTTLRTSSEKLSGPKDRYHSLSYSIYYSYPGRTATPPRDVNFEIRSVVKARRLNSDLYVVFVVDGKEIHYSSNRNAIRNPVPGKPWIGEKMVFRIPREDFLKMATAKTLGVKLGDVMFDFDEGMRASIKAMSQFDH
jgi:hypothetical protein